MFWLLSSVLVVVLVTRVYLRGEDLTRFDRPVVEVVHRHLASEAGRREIAELLQDAARQTAGLGWRARIAVVRQIIDDLGASHQLSSESLAVHNELVSGEWILPEDASTRRRLLYVHGGAWVAGSPLSHRGVVERMANAANAAVFALNYRLMPEHSRMDGIIDCRAAYEWLLVNGPHGAEPLEFFALAGDSAGANLALATVAWARDEGLRLPDRVVALSPVTDAVMASPSLRRNELSDLLLGPYLGRLNRWPRPLLWWLTWLVFRIPPADPRLSPLRDDLSGLPPILIQASTDEMLLDDAQRYVNKACASGSPVSLQLWSGMVHVWHIFADILPEAEAAFAEIAAFMADHQSDEPSEELL